MIEHTLFICDRKVGSGVGNENGSETTGGIFGRYVPMHYVAHPFPAGYEPNEWIEVLYAKGKDYQMNINASIQD